MSIWKKIKAALDPEPQVPENVEKQLKMAMGALLLEMCRADFKILREERHSIVSSIRDTYGLTAEDARELMEQAETESECAVSLQIYTSLIKEYSNQSQRLQLISELWRVAYADGELHQLESDLVDRVAKLLEIPPKLVERSRVELVSQFDLLTPSKA